MFVNFKMKKLGQLLSYCVLLMVTLSFFSIAIHFIFNVIFIPIQELIIYLHSSVFMLGIVYAFHYDRHVRIDIFTGYDGVVDDYPEHKNKSKQAQ